MTRRLTLLVAFTLAACEPAGDLGPCDVEAATSPIYYDDQGFPAYPGQALVDVSCGATQFCHAQGIAPEDRFGAPTGIELDVSVATSPEELERLRVARRAAWNLRHAIHTEVRDGRMPPTGPSAETALGAAPTYRANVGTPDERTLPSIDSTEGLEMLRNWLACGAQVIEATEGTSQGIGDIWPRGADAGCPTGRARCGDVCIDVTSDPMNCGACGLECGPDQACRDGGCVCLNGLDACGARCVDLQSDVANCGACGTSCGDRFCADTTCVDVCPADTTDCGGSCVDLDSSLANCGGCGAACGASETCLGGVCACAEGFDRCTDACVDLRTSPTHCGSCGNACAGGAECADGSCACPGGTTECGGACVSTATDPLNCGGCGSACAAGEGCVAGACVGCGPDVGFAADVEPIFVARCTSSGCHAGARPAASLTLTAGRAHGELVGVPASCGGRVLVEPGDVESSYLWNKLTGVGICSGNQMPKRGQSLADAELEAIRSWICRGAPDN